MNFYEDKIDLVNQYMQDRFDQAQGVKGWNVRYVPKALDFVDAEALNIKAIAFYLPQFHPIHENDLWWGKGFTEWTNVTKAVPQFVGHHQPHLPGELGFYDLRIPEVMQQQAELAKHYGITGFCFHHYWFGGKRLLEKPLQNLIEHKEIDIKFCVSWANENWSRRWDGLEDDILISQNHSPEDDINFFDSLVEAFRDDRYITVDGKPVLIVYRVTLLPDARATAERWRARALEVGLPGVYLVAAKSFNITDPTVFGFDAAVEFPPHQSHAKEITEQYTIMNPTYKGKIYDFEEVANRLGKITSDDHITFKTVMPSWDNEARKPGAGFSFVKSTPQNYAKWLNDACKTMMQHKEEDKRLVFINAWNEWAEGAHLEPDRYHGYAYLHATANVLRGYRKKTAADNFYNEHNAKFARKSDTAVVLHLYYEDLADSMIAYIKNIGNPDVFVTFKQGVDRTYLDKFIDSGLNTYLLPVENIGRDIRPFLIAYGEVAKRGYHYCCKLHTKRSLHRVDGDTWRSSLLGCLAGAESCGSKVIDYFSKNKEVGLLAPKGSITDLSVPEIHAGNLSWLDAILGKIGEDSLIGNYNVHFPSGSMFWFKVDALQTLLDLKLENESFELETGQLDGTLAHTIERLFGVFASKKGYQIQEINVADL
ncbi:glycoside hydrolase family 99-like domain-containing protein [Paraburkholderia fungorum]|jgi:lipopolysaccharide biosynthesis protein|uniref:glycoside hydrolase family 99-like domain-containing protein n=1 Tax=Paraburkholderia fungorum TaxID=134537 RepID=UPI0038B9C9BD